MIEIKLEGKVYKFDTVLEPGMSYVYHIEGHDIYITVSQRVPEFCRPLLQLDKVVNIWARPEEETS